jgi:hypothetical protein
VTAFRARQRDTPAGTGPQPAATEQPAPG